MNNRKKVICIVVIAVVLIIGACGKKTIPIRPEAQKENELFANYGVFLGIDETSFDDTFSRMTEYNTVVIDADALTDMQIAKLKDRCDLVYSYVDIGSLESYRSYYQRFEKMKLDIYAGWPDEYWMDVTEKEWQDFILDEYVPNLISKGIDGLFVDNLDVYYQYPTSDIYDGCEIIIRGLAEKGVDIIVNGGDTYVKKHLEKNGTIKDILTGINQEIENETGLDYYKTYVEEMDRQGVNVYIIEYTDSEKIKERISEYCTEKGYYLYITESLELK